jgi:Fe2+ or Zn2+ uptake regulation protein
MRPLLTSIRRDCRNGASVTLAICEKCGTVKAFHCTDLDKFPDTGYWIECRACDEWTFFFRFSRGRVINKRKSSI